VGVVQTRRKPRRENETREEREERRRRRKEAERKVVSGLRLDGEIETRLTMSSGGAVGYSRKEDRKKKRKRKHRVQHVMTIE